MTEIEADEPGEAASSVPSFDDVIRVRGTTRPPGKRRLAAAAKPPRIEEVAREAGVSPITVSRALRSPGMVSPATLARVRDVVQRTGYYSNPHASALRSGRSTMVAAFVSNLVSSQYGQAVNGCAEVLEAAGYQLMIGQTSYSYARETAAIQSLQALKPAAVFFTGVVELEDNRRALLDLDVPIVESWAYPRDPIDMLVGISNTDIGRRAAEHLVSRGRRRLAFMGRSGGRGRLRLQGFRLRAAELGAQVLAVSEVENVQSIAEGRAVFRDLVSLEGTIDAVFVANDLLAIGSLLETRRLGLRVPDDIAVLGLGDSDLAQEMSPTLSVIAIDGHEIGRLAGSLISKRLRGERDHLEHRCLPIDLIARKST